MQRFFGLFLIIALALVGCQKVTELAPQKRDNAGKAALLTNIPVSDGDFSGTFTVTHLEYVGGQLFVNGVISYLNNGTTVTQVVNDVSATLSGTNPSTSAGTELAATRTCSILFLDLGPIFLDVLGLQVDLSPVQLAIDAVTGQGNLLGNLLCAVTGLLDGGPLAGLLELIDNINRILDGVA